MKLKPVLATLCLCATTALAQGTVWFANFRTVTAVNAPVFDADGKTYLGSDHFAQLYAGPTMDSLAPVSAPVRFVTRSDGSPSGYFVGEKVIILTVPEGAYAWCQVRAWPASAAGSFEAAQAGGGKWGVSNVLYLMTGGDHLDPPFSPTPLVGLTSFSLVPEPAPSSLVFFSLCVLCFCRARSVKSRSVPNAGKPQNP
jgi:hypothetical protein